MSSNNAFTYHPPFRRTQTGLPATCSNSRQSGLPTAAAAAALKQTSCRQRTGLRPSSPVAPASLSGDWHIDQLPGAGTYATARKALRAGRLMAQQKAELRYRFDWCNWMTLPGGPSLPGRSPPFLGATMIRFTSTQLRPVCPSGVAWKGPVILEKNNGIFLRRSDLRPQVKEPMAWAEGCNPLSDDGWGWRKLSDCLITEKYFFHQFDLSQEACDAVLNEHQDLLVSFICQTPGAVGVFAETGEPEKVYLPVGILP